jgi:hypothetical protein
MVLWEVREVITSIFPMPQRCALVPQGSLSGSRITPDRDSSGRLQKLGPLNSEVIAEKPGSAESQRRVQAAEDC